MSKDIIASDFGYGHVKVKSSTEALKFPSLLTRKRNIRYRSEMNKGNEISNLSVKANGEEYFIGDLAYTQGTQVIQVLDKNKFMHKSTNIMIETALGYLARNLTGSPKVIDTITGLPVSAMNKENEEKLIASLTGSHEVEFDWSLIGKENEKVNFEVQNVKVVPQPIGTLFDMILDNDGALNDESLDLAESSVAIIDIGFGTTDFMISDGLEYIDKYSRSINAAVSNVCQNLSNQLSEELGEEIPEYEVQNILLTKEYSAQSKTYQLHDEIDAQIDAVFREIYTTGQSLWRQKKNINTFILSGGGCHLFYPKFVEALGEDADIRRPDFDVEGEKIANADPVYSNVSGFYKYMLRKQKEG